MKRSPLLGLLSLAATTLSTCGQSVIVLDNYNSYGPYVTYGDSITPANGISGAKGVQGSGVLAGSWTVQAYYAAGSISVPLDPTHMQDPGTLGLTAGTGVGSTAGIANVAVNGTAGAFLGNLWGVPGSSSAGGNTYTFEVAVYNGADFASSTSKGHSEAFTLVTSAGTATMPTITGTTMPAFSVYTTPEPSVFALSSICAIALMLMRRQK